MKDTRYGEVERYLSVSTLAELLRDNRLKGTDLLKVNNVGNIVIYAADKNGKRDYYRGYIEFGSEEVAILGN